MGCLQVTSCCCCSNLANGSRNIAIFELWVSFLTIAAGIALTVITVASGGGPYHLGILAGSATSVLVSAFLLYGWKTRKSAFVMAWLVVTMIRIVLSYLAFGAFIGVASYFETNKNQLTPDGDLYRIVLWALAGVSLPITMLWNYFWIVVHSFYKELLEELRISTKIMPV